MMHLILIIVFLILLVAVSIVDMRTMEIPNGFVIAAFVLGILSFFLMPEVFWYERLLGMICVSLPLLLITLVIPEAFGGGDIKLMAGCGLFLGWKLTLLSFFFAVLFGGAYGAFLLLTKKKDKKEHFAFGPFLCVGMAVALLWGTIILKWYMNLWLI